MKLRSIILALMCMVSVSAFCQFGVGIRDNRFIYGDFTFCKNYEVKLEHSVFSEKIGYQYLRAYAGYKGSWKTLDYKALAYFGAVYNGSYHSGGGMAQLRYRLIDRIVIDAVLNPHYDSGYGYKTCFSAGGGVIITRNIDILAAYTTIPEYRMSEKRVHVGFDFHVKGLSVTPALSVAADGDSKTIRALMGFRYQF